MKTQSVKTLERQYQKVMDLDMDEMDKLDTLEGIEGELEAASENEKRLNQLAKMEGFRDLTVVFTEEGVLDSLLAEIDEVARSIVFDANTDEGRKTGASVARKVSSSKVLVDNAGKVLTDDWAKKKAAVDAGRRRVREFCDSLRDEIKAPIEAWKAEQARIAAAEKLAAEFVADHEEALRRDDLYNREAAVREAEAKIAADKLQAESKAESDRLAAEQEKRMAVAAEQAIERERERADNEAARAKQAEIYRARDAVHKQTIHQNIESALTAAGFTKDLAGKFITVVATGMVPHIKIQY